ncbi:MAG: RNA-binding protein [Dehalococcoidia bacterium]|nr:RNA-binding protein [Dehalococcoidia bacterium]
MTNSSPETTHHRIQVGNLGPGATEPVLRGLFLPYGPIVSYDRPVDSGTGRPGRFVYIEMASTDAAAAVAGLTGHEIGGKVVTLTSTETVPIDADRHARSAQPRRTVLPPSTAASARADGSSVL